MGDSMRIDERKQDIIRPCRAGELEVLRALSMKTFDETFRSTNRPEVMDAYLAQAYAPDKLAAEMGNPSSRFFLAIRQGEAVGYLKLNVGEAQTEFASEGMLEIERIYVRASHQGCGIGNRLMAFALEEAVRGGHPAVWLGVWEHNPKAIAFYTRMGFYRIGQHVFRMGDEDQTDWLMRRDL